MTVLGLTDVMLGRAELPSYLRAEQIMSMPAYRPTHWTRAEVDRLVDQREGMSPRLELVDGELLMTPAPTGRHQRIILHLAVLLQSYLSRHAFGEVRLGPSELLLASGERFEPDLFIVPAIGGFLPGTEATAVSPLLICEVLSPGSSRHDRITKRKAFQAHGVPEFWIIDGDAEAFEIWRPTDARAALVDERLVWAPAGTPTPFELDLRRFFAAVASTEPLPTSQ